MQPYAPVSATPQNNHSKKFFHDNWHHRSHFDSYAMTPQEKDTMMRLNRADYKSEYKKNYNSMMG
jgi:hypothetical protein